MRGRRRKQLLYELKVTRGCWKLREEARKSHCLENSWNRLWTCRNANCGMMNKRMSRDVGLRFKFSCELYVLCLKTCGLVPQVCKVKILH